MPDSPAAPPRFVSRKSRRCDRRAKWTSDGLGQRAPRHCQGRAPPNGAVGELGGGELGTLHPPITFEQACSCLRSSKASPQGCIAARCRDEQPPTVLSSRRAGTQLLATEARPARASVGRTDLTKWPGRGQRLDARAALRAVGGSDGLGDCVEPPARLHGCTAVRFRFACVRTVFGNIPSRDFCDVLKTQVLA